MSERHYYCEDCDEFFEKDSNEEFEECPECGCEDCQWDGVER